MALVVFAGQSNTGGLAQDASTAPAAWHPDPQTFIWSETSASWQAMQPGVNEGYGAFTQTWGPELQFAIDFRAQHPGEPLYIVKSVAGGTQLAPSASVADWSPTSHGDLFDHATQVIDQASATLGQHPTALFWGQGEEDGNYQAAAQAYGQNLQSLFAAARSEWLHDPEGKIGFFQIGTSPVYASEVRAGEQAVDAADPNATSFDTAGYPFQSDSVHYSTAGLEKAGDADYQLYSGWSAGGATPASPPAPTAPPMVAPQAAAPEALTGGAGSESLVGGAGADSIRGMDGDDIVVGGAGDDDVNGNVGQDVVHGDDGNDVVRGGQGNDTVHGDAGDDLHVNGNKGDDWVFGEDGNDTVYGGQGADTVDGGAGADFISGDLGDDRLVGGAGADHFAFAPGGGHDTVVDFNPGEGDRIVLPYGTAYALETVGGSAVIDLGHGDTITLAGVAQSQMGDWLAWG